MVVRPSVVIQSASKELAAEGLEPQRWAELTRLERKARRLLTKRKRLAPQEARRTGHPHELAPLGQAPGKLPQHDSRAHETVSDAVDPLPPKRRIEETAHQAKPRFPPARPKSRTTYWPKRKPAPMPGKPTPPRPTVKNTSINSALPPRPIFYSASFKWTPIPKPRRRKHSRKRFT